MVKLKRRVRTSEKDGSSTDGLMPDETKEFLDRAARSGRWRVRGWLAVFAGVAVLAAGSFAGFGVNRSAAVMEVPFVDTEALELSEADTAGASGLAELFVLSWLNGEQVQVWGEVLEADLRPSGLKADAVWAVEVQALEPDYVKVVVAASMRIDEPDGGVVDAGSRFYSVGVFVGGSMSVVGLPTQVPSPVSAESVDLFVPKLGSVRDSDVREFVPVLEGFVRAYLAGNGSVTPFVASGKQVRVVQPAPFVSVVLDEVGVESLDNGDVIARVGLEGQDVAGVAQSQELSVLLTPSDGRWVVESVLEVPPLAARKGDR